MNQVQLVLLLGFLWATSTQGAQSYDLDDPAEPWSTARVGQTTDVPFPFQPLATDAGQVSMWGRTYELGSILPAQIHNQQAEMFGQDPRFVITTGGKRYELQAGKATVTLDRPDRVEWKGEFSAGDICLNATAWLEYDGVMRIDFTVSAEVPTEVDFLGLDFPLVPEVAAGPRDIS